MYVDYLKDERRPIAKVDIGKTRQFMAGPMHYLIACKMYFGDFSQFIIGETMGVNIATSDQASYYDGTNQVSAFSTDQTLMRAILREDFGVRYADAFIALNKVWSK